MSLFAHIKAQVLIQDVISEYVSLKPAGTYMKGSCPFHSERTASFTVSPHKNIYYCFGCHVSGDVIGFIAAVENCSQFEAANLLIDQHNIDVPQELLKSIPAAERQTAHDAKIRYFDLCEQVATWCHEQFFKSEIAKEYIDARGFTKATITAYQIGYFPQGSRGIKSLARALKEHGFMIKDLIEAHIVAEGKSSLYSPFENRIMFPIADPMGNHCGYGGRVFTEGDERAKYYNSRENPYFSKGSILFGLNIAKKAIQKAEFAFLVEGYTDCLGLYQAGYKNVIATLGTACTAEHLKLLSRYADSVYVLFDGDNAGQKAILRLTELCWDVNMELKVLYLPENEDPASFLAKGGTLEPLMAQAANIYSFFIRRTSENFMQKSLRKKLDAVRKVLEIVRNIRDPLKKDLLLQEAAYTLNITVDTLRSELKTGTLNTSNTTEDQQQPVPQPIGLTIEEKVLAALLNNLDQCSPEAHGYLVAQMRPPIRQILEKLFALKQTNPSITFDEIWSHLDEDQGSYVNRLLFESNEKEWVTGFTQLLDEYTKKHWKAIVLAVKARIEDAQSRQEPGEVQQLLGSLQMMKKRLFSRRSS